MKSVWGKVVQVNADEYGVILAGIFFTEFINKAKSCCR